MKFNPNQRYTRWSIRRLSVGVASVVVASGFFVLVGQPSSARADVVNPTTAQVVPNDASVSEKGDLPAEVLKKAVDVALPSEQSIPTPQASVDTTSSSEKADETAKEPVVAPKEEVQAQPDSKKQTEDTVKPVEGPTSTVSGQDREASEAQPATAPAEVQKGVADNTKDTVDVPASYLDKANFPGPFTAGVNQVIPYEFFAGDGMLTRLILKSSDKAPWSDNGTAKNPALPPVEKLGKGLYFYEVDLAGTQGKSDKELLDFLKQNGTQSYKATIKVYGAKDGKADLTNLVATKDLDVNLNGLTTPAEVQKGVADNTKDTVDVPASYLDKANFPGPFTAGVNQVIPYEFFAGDGMLTRLILKASDKAPWSDNGSAKNPALPPVEELGKGLYFYEVDLAGTQGKSDKELLDFLKQNGTQSYKATIKVYGAKDGKADLSNLVATKDLDVNLNGLTTPAEVQKGVADNTKDTIDVPATYLDKANFPGPFTAGVNQVIPYEFFAGDGMLTRLILKASDKAPWSDNGSAKNPALPPVEKLGKGLYFYEVDLAGTQGKSDKDLLDLLKQNGTQSYKATIKVYGAKDGKADLTNLVATKDLTVNLNGHQSLVPMQSDSVSSSNGSAMPAPMMNGHQDASNINAQMPSANQDEMKSKMPATSQDKMMPNKEQDKTMNASQPMATPSMKQDQVPAATSKMPDEGEMASNNKVSNPMMADQMKGKKDMLPYTGEAQTSMATLGFFGLALAGLLGGLGLKAKKEEND
ncbi:Cell wall surface anchor family protein [Streptococcus infantis]|uniref:Cell wall surface anchor family protein n=1 Tax=Streptococcus infantis TaxID=68892 RepID=A0A139RBH7_9STRE|nr:fibronectin-binding SSURE repeat-containing protein [Streptococcus infantis]KXU12054.1 Cell wall surface anchor family protein [Streptococcus infantis]